MCDIILLFRYFVVTLSARKFYFIDVNIMQTYLFDTINRYKRFSEELDVKTVICNKSWWVFNDSGEKELYIFNPDGKLDVIYSGRVTEGAWRYVSANKSIIVSANGESFMLDPAFVDNAIFALKLNGTDQYVFMIDENNTALFVPSTYKELMGYFEEKLNRAIAIEEAKVKAERKRLEEEHKQREQERIRLEAQKLDLYYQQIWIRERLPREKYEKFKKIFYIGVSVPIVVFLLSIIFLILKEFGVFCILLLILFLCAPFSVLLFLPNNVSDRCYNFLINKKDEAFKKEWKETWYKNWDRNFELYENNVDLEEIRKECLKG